MPEGGESHEPHELALRGETELAKRDPAEIEKVQEAGELAIPEEAGELALREDPGELALRTQPESSYRAGVVDNTEKIEDLAVYKAEQEITERRNARGGSFFKTFADKAYLRYFEEMERQRLIVKYRRQLDQDIADGKLREEELATIDRFVSDDADKLMHSGELKEEANEAITAQIKDWMMRFARGEISEEQLEDFRQQFIDGLGDTNREVFINNEYLSDNIIEVAKQIRLEYEHGVSLDRFDKEFELVLGNARGGLRTERQYSAVDKAMAFMRKTPVLNVLSSPAAVSIGLGFAYAMAKNGSRIAARSKLASLGTFGASAAIGFGYNALEKNRELKDRMFQHSREMAAGGHIVEGSEMRGKIEGFRLETISATETTTKINELLERGEFNPEDLKELLDLITEVKTRNEISDTEGVDLIGFSDVMKIEQERRDLDIALAQAEIAFRNNYSEEAFNGLSHDQLMEGGLMALSMNRGIEMDEKSDQFRRFKLKESLKAGAKGAVIAVIGTAVSSEVFGRLHQMVNPDNGISTAQLTPLQRIGAMLSGEKPQMHGALHEIKMGDGKVSLPKGVELIHQKDGSYSIFNSVDHKEIAGHLQFGKDGSLSAESVSALKSHGIEVSDFKSTITRTITEHRTVTDEDIIRGKGGEIGKHFQRVYRQMWYDNDTPMYRGSDGKMHGADLNELRLWWGGVNDTGIDKNGNFVYDISHMMKGGSFHGSARADFLQELRSGHMKLNLSLSREAQRYVASIKFNEHGQAIIPKDSPLAKIFFENRGGQAVFKGRFAEVSQVVGHRNGHDVVRMLATDEGKGIHTIGSDFVKQTSQEVHNLQFGIPRGVETDFVPFVAELGRDKMEQIGTEPEVSTENPQENPKEKSQEIYDWEKEGDFAEKERKELPATKFKGALPAGEASVSAGSEVEIPDTGEIEKTEEEPKPGEKIKIVAKLSLLGELGDDHLQTLGRIIETINNSNYTHAQRIAYFRNNFMDNGFSGEFGRSLRTLKVGEKEVNIEDLTPKQFNTLLRAISDKISELSTGNKPDTAPKATETPAGTGEAADTTEAKEKAPTLQEVLDELGIKPGHKMTIKGERGYVLSVDLESENISFSPRKDGAGGEKTIPIRFILLRPNLKNNEKVQKYLASKGEVKRK